MNDDHDPKSTPSQPAPKDSAGETTPVSGADSASPSAQDAVEEIGGRKGPAATRYGDWEKKGRCIDF